MEFMLLISSAMSGQDCPLSKQSAKARCLLNIIVRRKQEYRRKTLKHLVGFLCLFLFLLIYLSWIFVTEEKNNIKGKALDILRNFKRSRVLTLLSVSRICFLDVEAWHFFAQSRKHSSFHCFVTIFPMKFSSVTVWLFDVNSKSHCYPISAGQPSCPICANRLYPTFAFDCSFLLEDWPVLNFSLSCPVRCYWGMI